MRPNRSLPVLLAAVLALAACEPEAVSPPVNTESAPLTGTFAVTSRFEVPATVAAPGPLGDALRLVHGLAVDPGAALLDLADAAGVPAVGELRMVLPDALESELTDWMNGYLRGAIVDGTSPYARIAELDALVRSVLLRWELRSTLVLPEDAPGTHVPVSLAFDSPAGPVVVPLGATAPVTSGVGVTAAVSWPDGADRTATATVGDHAMGIPFGRYALQGLDAILVARYGVADVETFLSGTVDCASMAASVSARCVGLVCVGHEAELRAVCDGGLAAAASQLEGQILDLDFRAIHFERGTATAVGAALAPMQGPASLQDGVWTATIDLGNGAEAAAATFTAVR